jgi:dienelactone hydrolase
MRRIAKVVGSFVALALLCAARMASAADGPLAFDAKLVGGPNSGAAMEVWRPAGAGPFPAIVVLHGCDGVTGHHRTWAARLVSWGYMAAIVDSFHPRHVTSTCVGNGDPQPKLRAQDAFNAAAYLRTLPDVRPDRVGVIGFSHGGITTLFATLAGGGQPFAAAVAYYPACSSANLKEGSLATDLLILSARDDDWTLSAPCVQWVNARSGQPHTPTIKVYPVIHGFDLPFQPTRFAGHMLGHNDAAANDSYAMTEAFFAARLKK